jgi:hypothetical protein
LAHEAFRSARLYIIGFQERKGKMMHIHRIGHKRSNKLYILLCIKVPRAENCALKQPETPPPHNTSCRTPPTLLARLLAMRHSHASPVFAAGHKSYYSHPMGPRALLLTGIESNAITAGHADFSVKAIFGRLQLW